MISIILSGGSGSRLWPLSRTMYPKQFLALVSDHTMFQETIIRLPEEARTKPIIVCNHEHRFIAAENLQKLDINDAEILLESTGRNTAPAIAVAALRALKLEDDPIILVLPADHIISDNGAFQNALIQAKILAEQNYLVTFGIVPTFPHTGYGYIKKGEAISNFGTTIEKFIEKPCSKDAQLYFESSDYCWNSGMFMFKAKQYLNELKLYNSEILKYAELALENAQSDFDFLRLNKEHFECCPNISIDYAVMEKTKKAALVPLDAGWSDIGSWASLWENSNKDENQNAIKGDVVCHETKGSYIYAEHKLVTTMGVKDLIIVDTQDSILVAHKDESEKVKLIVNSLKEKKRPEANLHRTVYRPWGYYDSIDKGEHDQVKRIIVKPYAKLSLQKHRHRAEHWVVVKGRAKVTKGEDTFTLNVNESTYIPIGAIHALENPDDTPLELIEVQSGSYLGEDDIVRLEDKYGRKNI
jgi:mannose-1-phosphate guanylyltransferase